MAFSELKSLELDGASSAPNSHSYSVTYSKAILSYLQAQIDSHNKKSGQKVTLAQLKKQFLSGKTIKDGICNVKDFLRDRLDNATYGLVAKIEHNGRQFDIIARDNIVSEECVNVPGVEMDFPVSELYLDDGQFSLLEDII